ncbi:MAG: CAP domain-containing protein [Steroidobacter sp.]
MKSLVRLLALLSTAMPATAFADLADGVNAIRKRGCDGEPGIRRMLRPSRGLDAAAKQWSRGGRLRDALARTDYRMINSASMRVEGAPDERTMLEVLGKHYCDVILDPAFSEIGAHRSGRDVWIVVATPFTAPSASDAASVNSEVLRLVNQARTQARKCGRKSYGAVAPLKSSPLLDRAALAHAKDMASHSLFEHRGSDGSEPAQRVSKTGYRWRTVGENIAAGAADAQTVVKGWIDSPGHCTNIMGAQFSEMGVAYAFDPKSKAGIYWSQVFATPR